MAEGRLEPVNKEPTSEPPCRPATAPAASAMPEPAAVPDPERVAEYELARSRLAALIAEGLIIFSSLSRACCG